MKVKFNKDVAFNDNGQFKAAKAGEVFDLADNTAEALGDACSPVEAAKPAENKKAEESFELPKKSVHSNKAVPKAHENK